MGHRHAIKAPVLELCYIGQDFGCNSVYLFPDTQHIYHTKNYQEVDPRLIKRTWCHQTILLTNIYAERRLGTVIRVVGVGSRPWIAHQGHK